MAGQADLEAVLAEAREGRLKPLVLIYGDQEYLVRQAYDRLLQALVPEDLRAFNLEQHDGTRAEARSLLDSMATPPLMAGPKAVGVVEARWFQSRNNAEELLKLASEKWASGEVLPALRRLGFLVALAGWTWEEAASAEAGRWAEALRLDEAELALELRGWMSEALAQALRAGLAQPAQGDDAEQFREGLEALLEGGLEGTVLVCASPGADQRKRLFKLFHERGRLLDFRSDERGGQVTLTARAFLANLLKQRGLVLKARLGERLVAACGKDLGLLENELSKLQAWAWPRTELEDGDFEVVCLPPPQEKVFAILDALAAKDAPQAQRLLRRFTAADKGARYQIFGLLCGEARKLLLLRALLDGQHLPQRGLNDVNTYKAQVHERLGRELPAALAASWRRTNAWAQFQALKRARAFDAAQLRGLIEFLSQADVRLKSGTDHESVFEELVMRFCGLRAEAAF
ncbi:MAG: DNA polymerase III subunit delta [bacterium]